MARSRLKDPLKIFRYLVLFPGGTDADTVAGFTEVNGLEMSMAVDEIRGGGQNDAAQKSPGLPEFANVTFMRGQIINPENQLATFLFRNWASQAYHYQAHGYSDSDVRRDLRVIQLTAHGLPALTWEIVEAFPARYKPFADLKGGESGNSVEELEVAHEGFGNPDGIEPPERGGTLSTILGLN